MQPRSYIDMLVTPSIKSERPNAMAHDVLGLLVKFTHAIAARQGFKHALAFPQSKVGLRPSPGNVIRVFAVSRESLDSLADELEKQQFIRDYVTIGRIKAIPVDYKPSHYVEYERFRVPNRNSRLQDSRALRMAQADTLPYLRLNSSTSGHGFSLFIKPIYHDASTFKASMLEKFEPDVYGLSVATRRFALPVLQ